MDRTEDSGDAFVADLSEISEPADDETKPEIEPDSWRDLTEFVDQFSEAAGFAVLSDPDDGATGY